MKLDLDSAIETIKKECVMPDKKTIDKMDLYALEALYETQVSVALKLARDLVDLEIRRRVRNGNK
jgi:hypothetical protein